MKRTIVLPGDIIPGEGQEPGAGTRRIGDNIVATTMGLVYPRGKRVTVVPANGRYEPRAGDLVVGTIIDANPGNWIINIRAPWPAPLHVSEAPWRVDFGETAEYLAPGDTVLAKVLFVDDQKKVQVTLKDRNLNKLEGGEVLEFSPSKVARVIGKKGSMLNLIKEYVECWLFVGQNGRVWINGEPDEVLLAKEVITMISEQAHVPGLTDRVRAFLEERKPGGVDAGLEADRDDSEEE